MISIHGPLFSLTLLVAYKFIALSVISVLMTPKLRPSIQSFPWTFISRYLFTPPTGYLTPKVYSELWVPPHPQLYLTHPTFLSLAFHWVPLLQTWNNFDLPTGFTIEFIHYLLISIFICSWNPTISYHLFSLPDIFLLFICFSSLSLTSMQASWRWGFVFFITAKF